ncbi:MAG: hypothetical protein M3186_15335, partial [Actinomycetota bacterium]|nr:hypothetical protein [Actinomycetota bacterium]
MRNARQGTGQVAVVEGEAGIGKTRLLTEIIARTSQGSGAAGSRRPAPAVDVRLGAS